MIAPTCRHARAKMFGKTASGEQRYRCLDCGKTFTASTRQLAGMRLGLDKAAQIIAMLCEGCSVRVTARLTDTDPHTIIDLLVLVGERCKTFLEKAIARVIVDDVQVDEVWQFIYCKAKTAERKRIMGAVGDSWCFTAVERTTKLVVAWHFGHRTQEDTDAFCTKLRAATNGRIQVSTDGFGCYLTAVPAAFAGQVDFGLVIKQFGQPPEDEQRRYSPARIIGIQKKLVCGEPDRAKICTSHTERANGTMRTFIKRMGRLTYCFSKRWDNHEAALGLYFAHYNFCRRHATLDGDTPAMATGLADHVWTVRDLLERVSN